MRNLKHCQSCGQKFEVEYDEEGWPVSTKLCYHCFEDGVEQAHFDRLDRIARENEF